MKTISNLDTDLESPTVVALFGVRVMRPRSHDSASEECHNCRTFLEVDLQRVNAASFITVISSQRNPAGSRPSNFWNVSDLARHCHNDCFRDTYFVIQSSALFQKRSFSEQDSVPETICFPDTSLRQFLAERRLPINIEHSSESTRRKIVVL